MTSNDLGNGLEIKGLTFAYEDWQVRFDLALPRAGILAIIGPSGAGKSTLLNLIAGFETPSAGATVFAGNDISRLPPAERPVTMLFQDSNVFAHLDAETNVGLGISPSLKLTAKERSQVAAALERVGLGGFAKRLPGELSGGQRQRVAIARALVRAKPLLLLDEPFAALGPALKADMLDLVVQIQQDLQLTVLFVSHQPEDARRIATHTAFLQDGEIAAMDKTKALFARRDIPGLKAYLGTG